MPIRTVLFTALSKYDGSKARLLQAREFHQIAGRAGRAGFDSAGAVVVQAPEHVVENERALAKAGDDPKKRRKVVRKKPPERFVSWGKPTFERLVAADPEPLQSSFVVSHAMLLGVIGRPGDAFAAMRHLLTDNDEPPAAQRRHIRRAFAIYRALLAGGVVERLDEPDEQGRRWRLTVDLQDDFALNQPLSLLALATIGLLDRDSPGYALDVVSVIEATLDDPRELLAAQLYKARGEAVAQMKADGIEYEERMELLDDVTYPMPLADLLAVAYDTYRRGHPWVADHELSPKSVARDMYERAMTFTEYTGFYGLSRAEGLVLRYLAGAYKALRQTVPEEARTDELTDLIEWLGELVRQTDSSLIDEWERLRSPAPNRPPRWTSGCRRDRQLAGSGCCPQRAVPPRRAGGPAPVPGPGRAGCRGRLGRRCVGGRHRGVFRRTRRDRHRGRCPWPGPADHRPAARAVDGAADLRRPGRRSRLGHQRRGGPRRLGRGGHRRRPGHRRGPDLAHGLGAVE